MRRGKLSFHLQSFVSTCQGSLPSAKASLSPDEEPPHAKALHRPDRTALSSDEGALRTCDMYQLTGALSVHRVTRGMP